MPHVLNIYLLSGPLTMFPLLLLQATASPAAREIQYSKVEGRDAQNLAEVMQFHARRQVMGLGVG